MASEKEKIGEILRQYKGVKKWKIDFENKNKPLRVEGYGVTAQKIITSLRGAGFKCEEIEFPNEVKTNFTQ